MGFLRIIIYIIAIILGVASDFTRAGYRSSMSLYDGERQSNRIRAFFRRRRVLRMCKRFVSRNKQSIVLRNNNVVVAYDGIKKTIMCINAQKINVSTIVEWEAQPNYMMEDLRDNTFELAFDNICESFNEKSTYPGLVQFLKKIFNIVRENIQPSNESIRKEIVDTQKAAKEKMNPININEASENELAQLPGINIAIAKKIIQRVNKKGCYISVDQMCQEMKIKNHFRTQLYDYLCAKPILKENTIQDNIKNINGNNDDRIIDL